MQIHHTFILKAHHNFQCLRSATKVASSYSPDCVIDSSDIQSPLAPSPAPELSTASAFLQLDQSAGHQKGQGTAKKD